MKIDKTVWLYPILGAAAFVLLSFAHDRFRTERELSTYMLPLVVGLIVGGVIGYFRDKIEARTRMYERQLSKEREDAVLGRAAAAIAHEVRNPLNALGMGLQRLQMEARELSPDHRKLIELMLDSLHHANDIIGNLLRYSKPQHPRVEPFDLKHVVEELLILYRDHCKELGIELRERFYLEEPVRGDPNLIRQVVENLVRNAIEAQPAGGFLEIELKRGGSAAALSIRNSGFTLPPQESERIFEPYFTTKAQGTGLGVSIARRIVEAHGGAMKARASGEGRLEISLTLPLAPKEAAS